MFYTGLHKMRQITKNQPIEKNEQSFNNFFAREQLSILEGHVFSCMDKK